jgi:hypothetical protein
MHKTYLSNRDKKVAGKSVNCFISVESKRKFIEMIPQHDSKQKYLNGMVCSSMFTDVTMNDDTKQFFLLQVT